MEDINDGRQAKAPEGVAQIQLFVNLWMSETAIEKINKQFTNILWISSDIFRKSHEEFGDKAPRKSLTFRFVNVKTARLILVKQPNRCLLTSPNFI